MVIDKIIARIQKQPNGCWYWRGHHWQRYPAHVVQHGGVKIRVFNTLYEHFIGLIPKGKDLHHTCQDRKCVNPHHGELLTRSEHSQCTRRDNPPTHFSSENAKVWSSRRQRDLRGRFSS
jgi:hypothetical protein